MNEEEIKELLEELKNDDYISPYQDVYSVYPIKTIDKKQTKLLLKYITNLQQKVDYYENFEINKTVDKIRLRHNKKIKELHQKLDQYKNNWEELKKMFETDEHFEDGCYCGEILNKMKELEENN